MDSNFYVHKRIAAPIATDATISTYVSCGGYKQVAVEIPTAEAGTYTATCNVYCKVAYGSAGPFRRVKVMDPGSSAGTGIVDWEVPSSAGNFFSVVPCQGYNYMKVELGASADSTVMSCYVHLMG